MTKRTARARPSPAPKAQPKSPPRLEDLLCFLVYATGAAFNRVYRKPLEQLGLTYSQFLVMVVLWAEDGLTVGQIGDRLGLDSGTLTPLLKRLEALGFVGRERTKEDERRVMVRLTAKGRKLADQTGDVMRCVRDAVDLSANEAEALAITLRSLRQRLDEAAEAA